MNINLRNVALTLGAAIKAVKEDLSSFKSTSEVNLKIVLNRIDTLEYENRDLNNKLEELKESVENLQHKVFDWDQ